MAKQNQPKRKSTAQSRKPDMRRRRLGWIMAALLIPLTAGIILISLPTGETVNPGYQFTKEGVLSFIESDSGRILKTIDIEVAADDLEIQRGLMWRRAMKEEQGMLFIMEEEEMQSFWMLNTYIPLDIIFVDAQLTIVTIQANREPQSLGDVKSGRPAKYVVEVNAGFCAKFGITVGDKINFQYN